PYDIASASFLGADGDEDRIRGARIQSDGTVVLAANIGASAPGDVEPILLNGATETSGGAIIRLSADGRSILSVTRIAAQVEDLALDASDTIYVAAWEDGLIKLDSTASTLLFADPANKVMRVDAGDEGMVAALQTDTSDPDSSSPGNGRVVVYDAEHEELGNFAGRHNTLDVCLDTASQTVAYTGWRQASAFDGNKSQPVQIAYLRGATYDGSEKYTAYDWSSDAESDRFLNKPENNMADTRGYRCTIGGDGKLYAAFEVAGGNHIFRYSPFDIMTKIDIVGGDQWQEFYNSSSEHKTFFARYEPDSGEYLLGQQLTGRLNSNRANTIRVNGGSIAVDGEGRVYIGGASASGLPMPPHEKYEAKDGETTFNPFPDGYLGGAWFMVMSADFKTRLYTTRLATGGTTHAIDARTLEGGATNIVFGGQTRNLDETYTKDAVQEQGSGEREGWFAVIGTQSEPQPEIEAVISANPMFAAVAPLEVTFDASGSTTTTEITSYEWDFGDGNTDTGETVTHTYDSEGVYEVELTVTDAEQNTATDTVTIIVGGSQVFLPLTVR
ncbi:MAG: PKD domain-containing protein, partial [Chloroflexota bacterium]